MFLPNVVKSGNRKNRRLFKDFHSQWFDSLNTTFLPLLRSSISAFSNASLLHSHHSILLSDICSSVQMLHNHFQAYFQALDDAARHDVSQLLFPDWRNSLEKPFLWLGDLHPALFIYLLRSFLSDDNANSNSNSNPRPLPFSTAWNNPPRSLTEKIEQIERGLRLMVPALAAHVREAQAKFLDRVSESWALCRGAEQNRDAVNLALTTEMEELMSVFVDANRLRGSVLSEIIGAINVYQAALYLEGLAQILVGFRDAELLHSFKHCKMPLSSID